MSLNKLGLIFEVKKILLLRKMKASKLRYSGEICHVELVG